jgi:hypothetical protein
MKSRKTRSEVEMNSTTFDDREENWDAEHEEEQPDDYHVPVRPRRKFLNAKTAALIAVITAAAGFYGGIRVEKGQVSSSSAASGVASRFSALASRFSAAGAGGAASTAGASGAAGTRGAAGASGAAGPTSSAGAAADAGGFAARFGGGGNASIGTISSISGNTLYLSTTGGNTVKVTLSSATTISKNETVGKSKVRPGDTVTVSGLKKSNGTIVATSVSDTGAGTGAGSATGGASSGSSAGGSAGVSSLFQAGGGS